MTAHDASAVVGEFLRLVQDRRDALGDAAEPADVRLAMMAAELAVREVADPRTDADLVMSELFDVPLVNGMTAPHVARQVDAVRWAIARLKAGCPDYAATIRTGLVAARRLVSDPPRVDQDGLRLAITYALLGGADGGNTLAPDQPPAGSDDE